MDNHSIEQCKKAKLAIQDTLDVVGGKWKFVLISIMQDGPKGFNELIREAGISPKILSKELQEMELNGLVFREEQKTKPITVHYSLTPYSRTLDKVLNALEEWGTTHRKKVISGK
ncbi:helix-turn-helix domain-containing protein [Sphingobacterium thermophilum]|uniref:HTH hxlR-type domain-containing protein n=1 Tax=Sphingobacterium thermophilum TaxID=768534 RepID=A0ABP8R7G3_9SPHI